MAYENRKYIIFDTSETGSIDYTQVFETDNNSLRLNSDGTQTFVKYDGNMPQMIIDLTTKSIEYTHSEIKDILRTVDWQCANPDDD
jgi:hypothetical protein